MTIRRLLWVIISLLVLLVLAGGSLLAWFVLRDRSTPARLVVVGPDKSVSLLGSNGSAQVLATDAKTDGYSFPAIAPDHKHLAYVVEDANGAAIVLLDLESRARSELYRSSAQLPIDLAWSPDSKYIVFLSGGALTLQIVPIDKSAPAQQIADGAPSYFAWSPDGKTLLLHIGGYVNEGGQILIYHPGDKSASSVLNDPGLFQAPAWSLDGQQFFYVAQPPLPSTNPSISDVKSDIMRVSAAGKQPTLLAREEQADLRIIRAPTSDQIAYSTLTLKGFGPLKLVSGSGGPARVISHPDDHVTAFFWSPDGKQIAYLTHAGEFTAGGPRTWHIVDVSSGSIRDLAPFQPSMAFVALQRFFDAYTFSFSPWSPLSNQLAYGADDGVYVIDTTSGTASKKADGELGMWVGER